MRNLRRMLATGMVGGWNGLPTVWTDIAAPSAAFSWLPFTVQQLGRTFRTKAEWTIDGHKPTGKAYYVSTTGIEGATGLDAAHPMLRIMEPLSKPDVDVVYIKSGVYSNNNGFFQTNPTRSISFIATEGPVYVGIFATIAAWTADGGAYSAARTFVRDVRDSTNLDAYGDFTALALVANAAACRSTSNSYYTDGATLWVHTFDNRSPGPTDLRIYFSVLDYAALFTTGNTNYYFENINFEGGIKAGVFISNDTNPITAYFKDCTFKYSSKNGLSSAASGITYCQGCVASKNGDDGFNYHKNSGAASKAVEINCVGRDNGAVGDIDNGSTMHDGGIAVRIMGEYARCVGRVVHDVTSGTKSWNLGCYAHDSASVVNDCNWGLGITGPGDTTEMWLDCCKSDGSATDIEIADDAVCHIRNFQGGGVYIGTPAAY